MYLLRQHTWRRSANLVVPIAVSDDISLLEERAQGILPADKDDLLLWTEEAMSSEASIRYSTPWNYGPHEHYFSIITIPHLTT